MQSFEIFARDFARASLSKTSESTGQAGERAFRGDLRCRRRPAPRLTYLWKVGGGNTFGRKQKNTLCPGRLCAWFLCDQRRGRDFLHDDGGICAARRRRTSVER